MLTKGSCSNRKEKYSPFIVIMIFLVGQSFFVSLIPTGVCDPLPACSEVGWFGPNCQFLCHCKLNICLSNGSCEENDTCTYGYFGPACQWVDLAIFYGVNTNSPFLVDDNTTTCNPNETSPFVDVNLKLPMPFSFFRIQVINGSAFLTDFVVILNNGSLCEDLNRFVYSPSVVDVICDTELRLSRLRIHGRIAPTICSVQIGGGRNLAVRQKVTMSSVWPRDYNLSKSEHAVDGNLAGNFLLGHCSNTNLEDNPKLVVHLAEPSRIYRVVIYTRTSAKFARRIEGFILETYDEEGRVVEQYVETSTTFPSSYHVHLINLTFISAISVSLEKINSLRRVLTICELEAYGDIQCSSDTYGLQCENPCSCRVGRLCNPFVGTCTGGCRAGYYSPDCTVPCSPTCDDRMCHFKSGYCYRCLPGYLGKFCETVCDTGTWGQDCSEPCSAFCHAPCHPVNGFCECKENFTGDLCEDCVRGRFGENCTRRCPRFCGINPCDRESGECLHCTGRRIGHICEDCEMTYHGPMCNFRCSDKCANRTCEKNFGRCFACVQGYSGEFCASALHEHHLMFYAVPLLLVVLTAFCCYCLLAATESAEKFESSES